MVFLPTVGRQSDMVDRLPKGVAQGALCIDHVMLVEDDMEVLDHIEMLRIVARDRSSIDQIPGRHQNTVDVQRMRSGNVQVRARNVVLDGGSPDTNRRDA